ncbi:MAG: hypothetical protein WKH64_14170 [Chloroflexia bacterium]
MPTFDFSRFLNIRMASGATLSPAGDEIAFLYDVTGVPQVWKVFADGGWPEQLTFFPERVSALEWSPSGGHIFSGWTLAATSGRLYALSPDGRVPAPGDRPRRHPLLGRLDPDGAQIAYTSNARTKVLRRLHQAARRRVQACAPTGRYEYR